VAANGEVGELLDLFRPVMRREEFESANPQMAGRDAGQHRAGQRALAAHHVAGGDHGQRPRCRNAKRRHRLADQVFAQRRTKCALAVATARKWRAPGTLEGYIASLAVSVDHFAQQ
jgi:hypothetical protein